MDNGKFAARNADGVKQEKLGVRPTDYSEWNRTLGQNIQRTIWIL